MLTFFILGGKDDHGPVESDELSWWQWFTETSRDGSRFVAQSTSGGFFVSTIFLGIDHNFGSGSDKRPWLFETVVFEGGESGDCWHCATWDEALAQHARAVEDCRARTASAS